MQVLIVDDHPLYREGLKALLLGIQPDAVVAGVDTIEEGVAMQDQGFDLILLDLNLPGLGRVDGVRRMKAACDQVPVVVISGEEDPALVMAVIDAGAAGYVPKSTDINLTIQALKVVLAQGIYLPARLLLSERKVTAAAPASASMQALTTAQQRVFACLAKGMANKSIARELGLAEGTVKAHLWSIYQLLGVSTRTQAMYRAHELGWLATLGGGAAS